jgi:general secretion pathway protein K
MMRHAPSSPPPSQQRGAALLAAMLTVALIATLAAGAFWQQWRSTEVEGAERQRTQARWLLVGALDWARVILREDARSGDTSNPSDHLAEPWAVPLQEARLSSFLAALPDGTARSVDDEQLADQVFLSGQIQDLQARLNVTNLLNGDKIDSASLIAFERLFNVLGVPSNTLSQLSQGLLAAKQQSAEASLMPQSLDELAWLGIPPSTLRTLAPYVTVLPERTPVNVNTASVQVLYASITGLGLNDAQRLVDERQRQYWNTLTAFQKSLGRTNDVSSSHSVNTRFFEVMGQLRMPQTRLQERSVVQRDNLELKVVWRESVSLQ